jgi:non-ribosomal peptide synthetase component F
MSSRREEDLVPPVFKSASFSCLYDLLAHQAEHRPDAIAIAAPGFWFSFVELL